MALAGHSGMQTAQSMHSSGSMTRKLGPSRKQSTGHTSTQSVYLHLIQFSVTTWVIQDSDKQQLFSLCRILPNAAVRGDHNPGRGSAGPRGEATRCLCYGVTKRTAPNRAIMIITSLLDTDLYKFSMMQVVLHHFPAAQVKYRYKCRTPGINLQPYLDEIRAEAQPFSRCRLPHEKRRYWVGFVFTNTDSFIFCGCFTI